MKRKYKGYMLLSAVLSSVIFMLLAGAFISLYGGQFSRLQAANVAMEAQRYAEIAVNTLTLTPYDKLEDKGRQLIDGSDSWQEEISIGPEKTIGESGKQRIATVKIYKVGEALPRYSLQVPLSSQGDSGGGVPVGTVIAWPLVADPGGSDKDKWIECNGQAVDAIKYPKLAALMSHVPNYRGVFLRGYGAQTSTHFGVVLHESGELGALQGDSIRNIVGSILANGVEAWPILTGTFYKAGEAYQNGYGHSQGPVPKIMFDASRAVPTDTENRPVNVAVRYLIKAA